MMPEAHSKINKAHDRGVVRLLLPLEVLKPALRIVCAPQVGNPVIDGRRVFPRLHLSEKRADFCLSIFVESAFL
jgi:hypothetical protein